MEASVWCCKEVDEGYESEFWHSCKGHFYEGAHKTAGQDGQENSGIPGVFKKKRRKDQSCKRMSCPTVVTAG